MLITLQSTMGPRSVTIGLVRQIEPAPNDQCKIFFDQTDSLTIDATREATELALNAVEALAAVAQLEAVKNVARIVGGFLTGDSRGL